MNGRENNKSGQREIRIVLYFTETYIHLSTVKRIPDTSINGQLDTRIFTPQNNFLKLKYSTRRCISFALAIRPNASEMYM